VIQFYSNNATNLRHLTTHSTTALIYKMAIVLRPQICDVISTYVYRRYEETVPYYADPDTSRSICTAVWISFCGFVVVGLEVTDEACRGLQSSEVNCQLSSLTNCNNYCKSCTKRDYKKDELECGPMPNVTAALPNRGGVLCSTPQSLADAHYWSAVQ